VAILLFILDSQSSGGPIGSCADGASSNGLPGGDAGSLPAPKQPFVQSSSWAGGQSSPQRTTLA